MKKDLDEYIKMVCTGGWIFLPAEKILFEHGEDIKFQEAASYACILIRVSDLLKQDKADVEGKEYTGVFYNDVDELISYYRNDPIFNKLISQKRWSYIDGNIENDVEASLEFLVRFVSPENSKTEMEEMKIKRKRSVERLVASMKILLPEVPCIDIEKLGEYSFVLSRYGPDSSEANQLFELHTSDANLKEWMEAQRKYQIRVNECKKRKSC